MKTIFIVYEIFPPVLKNFFNKYKKYSSDYCELIQDTGIDSISTGYFWYKNLKRKKLFNVIPIVINSNIIQKKWIEENDVECDIKNISSAEIFEIQLKKYKPEIIFFNNFNSFEKREIIKLKNENEFLKLLITWEGIAVCDPNKFDVYDIILSPLHYLTKFYNENGIKTYYMPLAFDKEVLNYIDEKKQIDVSFVGSINLFKKGHFERLKFLYYLSKKIKVQLFLANLSPKRYIISLIRCIIKFDFKSIIYLTYITIIAKKPKLGLKMLSTIQSSKISLNFHIDAAKNEAANLRLYEVTGVGTCLLTDHKDNLDEHFKLNDEVISFQNVDDCSEIIKNLLENPQKLKNLSLNGKRRTLDHHSYEKRTERLLMIIEEYLKKT